VIIINILFSIFKDGFFAALAGIGFGAISDPPLRSFKWIAVLAFCGHAARFIAMTYTGLDIATSSLIGGLVIGFGALYLGKRSHTPLTVLYIPSLLPMIPGKFAYNMVFSLIMFLQNMNGSDDIKSHYIRMFLSNSIVTTTVVFLLAVGATLPFFFFPKIITSVTRKKHTENEIDELKQYFHLSKRTKKEYRE
jgi:uncharacterized membrane protein YjjB (DUF3815 family)